MIMMVNFMKVLSELEGYWAAVKTSLTRAEGNNSERFKLGLNHRRYLVPVLNISNFFSRKWESSEYF